jgi:hypothetical protein
MIVVTGILSLWIIQAVTHHPSGMEASDHIISSSEPLKPEINATTLFNTGTMILGNDIKNLVILIPNEAHESPQGQEGERLIGQPYVPQNAIVSNGTKILWFNANVGHSHKVTLTSNEGVGSKEQVLFDTGYFAFNEASRFVVLNKEGTLTYQEAVVDEEDKSFAMNGTIKAVNQPLSSNLASSYANQSTISNKIDTVGTYVLPSKDLEGYVSEFTDKGFIIENTHTFKDLHDGQKGTGDEQTLVVWTTSSSSGMTLGKVLSALQEITPRLPYI